MTVLASAEIARLQALCHRFEGSIRVLQMIGATLDLAEVLGHFEREARRLVAFDRLALVLLAQDESADVRLVSLENGGDLAETTLPREAVRAMHVLEQWRPIKRNLWPGEFRAPDDARAFAAGVQTLLEIPLSLPDAPLGVASFGSYETEAFEAADTIVLGALAASLGQAVAHALTVERLRGELRAMRAMQGIPETGPDAVRAFLGDHLHQSRDWFDGLAQGLLLAGVLDTYQIERLEDWWSERASSG